MRTAHKISRKTEGKSPFGNLGIDGRIILKFITKK
jgi:hypothetical protein